jgi:hypothetical protein
MKTTSIGSRELLQNSAEKAESNLLTIMSIQFMEV